MAHLGDTQAASQGNRFANLTRGHVLRSLNLGKSGSSKMQEQFLHLRERVSEVGEFLERTGQKIENKGFDRIGDVVGRIGSRIAHLSDQQEEEENFSGSEDKTATEESTSLSSYPASKDSSGSYPKNQDTRVKQDIENLGEKKETSDAV